MKRMKKLASLLLAVVMVMAMGLTAMAATVTIDTEGNDSILKEHTFVAYQIFKGTNADSQNVGKEGYQREDNALGDIEWGDDINGDAFLTALKNLDFGKDGTENKPFAACASAKAVAEILGEKKADSNEWKLTTEQLNQVARLAENNLKSGIIGVKLKEGENVLGDGYYLIVDTTTLDGENVKNLSLLQVTDNVAITVKTDKPGIKKKIIVNKDGTDELVDYHDLPIGETEHYQLKSNVPDMTSFAFYRYVVSDIISKGLTLDEDSFEITIGEVKLTKVTDYSIEFITVDSDHEDELNTYGLTTDPAKEGRSHTLENNKSVTLEYVGSEYIGGEYFRIVFTKFFEDYYDHKGEEILIKYDAVINENAVIGEEGNPNKVHLQYSNNPNKVEGGEPSPDFIEPEGVTPWDTVRTFETSLELMKVDGQDMSFLVGAVFTVEGTQYVEVLKNRLVFKESSDGDYYKLTDDTFTTIPPTTDGMDESKYVKEADGSYVKYVAEAVLDTDTKERTVDLQIEVGEDGKIKLEGLTKGNYLITEVKAPDGYNKLEKPILVVIGGEVDEVTPNDPDAAGKMNWNLKWGEAEPAGDSTEGIVTYKVGDIEYKFTGEPKTLGEDGSIEFAFDVANNRGTVLPETGGIGTTIFYTVGAILVLGAIVLLVTKKRMSKEA